jgi:hypothetical protein
MTLHDCTSTYAKVLNVYKLVVVGNTTCSRCHVCQASTKINLGNKSAMRRFTTDYQYFDMIVAWVNSILLLQQYV